jgi:probable rRNA maturation factor
MRSLNKKYLGHDYVTDVITFNLGGETPTGLLGPICAEIVICPQVALQNAKLYRGSVKNEILLYLIHGLLHLAGYDDHNPKDIQQMRAKEKELMGKVL